MLGIPLQVPPASLFLCIDASLINWRTHLQNFTAAGVLPLEEKELHINVLDMEAVQLTFNTFLPRIL